MVAITESSISDSDNLYKKACQLAVDDDRFFSVFKRNPHYTVVLEHVNQQQGQAYLELIRRDNPHLLTLLPQFKRNDLYGTPVVHAYEGTIISPTTLRYIKVLSDMMLLFGSMANFNIVEIGCGYGGQCEVIAEHFPFQNYELVDLDVVLSLTEKYLTKLDVKNFQRFQARDQYDLVISNYAFTECRKEIQDNYLRDIINKSKRGYITANFIGDGVYSLNELLSKIEKNVNIKKEEPQTHAQNVIIYWDETQN